MWLNFQFYYYFYFFKAKNNLIIQIFLVQISIKNQINCTYMHTFMPQKFLCRTTTYPYIYRISVYTLYTCYNIPNNASFRIQNKKLMHHFMHTKKYSDILWHYFHCPIIILVLIIQRPHVVLVDKKIIHRKNSNKT